MEAHVSTRLDKFAIALLFVGIGLMMLATPLFYRWLVLAAAAGAFYGWKTVQPDLVKACCLTPPLYLVGWWIACLISQVTPHPIDATLASLDHGAGIAVWRWCESHPLSHLILRPTYYSLGMAMIAGMCFTERRAELTRALLIAPCLGFLCYYLFPAVGPTWVGTPSAVRNAMPSMHLTWALLIWIYASHWFRLPAFVFVLLTAAATMGLGEHYAVDLVAALPFTFLVCCAAGFLTRRVRQPLPSECQAELAR